MYYKVDDDVNVDDDVDGDDTDADDGDHDGEDTDDDGDDEDGDDDDDGDGHDDDGDDDADGDDDDGDDDGNDDGDDDDDDDDVRACAIEIHMNISQEPFCGNLQEQCCTPIPRHPFCASLRGRNAHGHFTRAILYGNLQGKCHTRRIPSRLNTGP